MIKIQKKKHLVWYIVRREHCNHSIIDDDCLYIPNHSIIDDDCLYFEK